MQDWLWQGLGATLRDAVIVAAVCSLVGVGLNLWIHPEGIPFVARKAYETLVPCPEPQGEVAPLIPGSGQVRDRKTFVVDAREAADFQRWHLPGAMNIAYDYLVPPTRQVLRKLSRDIASSRAQRVVVYGDGDDPDTGQLLAKDISLHGIKNVFYVRGGGPALRGKAASSDKAAEPAKEDRP
jgi:hypothetical protein